MGKVQEVFGIGCPGAVSRSVDEIVISLRNASETEIPFGAPVFLAANGAVPFDVSSPQDFTTFLGFAVRVADKTPDTYPSGQSGDPQEGTWKPGDVMEILVRGGVAPAEGNCISASRTENSRLKRGRAAPPCCWRTSGFGIPGTPPAPAAKPSSTNGTSCKQKGVLI